MLKSLKARKRQLGRFLKKAFADEDDQEELQKKKAELVGGLKAKFQGHPKFKKLWAKAEQEAAGDEASSSSDTSDHLCAVNSHQSALQLVN